VKLSAVRTNEGRLFQTVRAQHENRRAAMFVDEDCVDSRSNVDELRTRDCLYDESRPVRYEGCCSLTALQQRTARTIQLFIIKNIETAKCTLTSVTYIEPTCSVLVLTWPATVKPKFLHALYFVNFATSANRKNNWSQMFDR